MLDKVPRVIIPEAPHTLPLKTRLPPVKSLWRTIFMPIVELTTQLNDKQREELGKSLFNLGNLCFSSLVLTLLVLGKFDSTLLLIGCFFFAILYMTATILLANTRRFV
jgi:hypothetical protein